MVTGRGTVAALANDALARIDPQHAARAANGLVPVDGLEQAGSLGPHVSHRERVVAWKLALQLYGNLLADRRAKVLRGNRAGDQIRIRHRRQIAFPDLV